MNYNKDRGCGICYRGDPTDKSGCAYDSYTLLNCIHSDNKKYFKPKQINNMENEEINVLMSGDEKLITSLKPMRNIVLINNDAQLEMRVDNIEFVTAPENGKIICSFEYKTGTPNRLCIEYKDTQKTWRDYARDRGLLEGIESLFRVNNYVPSNHNRGILFEIALSVYTDIKHEDIDNQPHDGYFMIQKSTDGAWQTAWSGVLMSMFTFNDIHNAHKFIKILGNDFLNKLYGYAG